VVAPSIVVRGPAAWARQFGRKSRAGSAANGWNVFFTILLTLLIVVIVSLVFRESSER